MEALKKLDTLLGLTGAIFLTVCYLFAKDPQKIVFLQSLVYAGWIGFFALTNGGNKKTGEQ